MTRDQETEQIIREAKGLRIELRDEESRWEGDFMMPPERPGSALSPAGGHSPW